MNVAVELIGGIALGLAALVLLGAGLRKIPLPTSWSRRLLPFELTPSAQAVAVAIGDIDDPRRAKAVRRIRIDFVFIVYYTSIFAAFAVILALGDSSWSLWIGIAGGAFAIVTALADVRENAHVLHVLRLTRDRVDDEIVGRMRSAALLKWAFCAATVALLSGLFWGDGRDASMWWFGVAYVLVSAIGVVALVDRRLILVFFFATALVVVTTLALFAFAPERFTQGY